jgi:hypothetical protein
VKEETEAIVELRVGRVIDVKTLFGNGHRQILPSGRGGCGEMEAFQLNFNDKIEAGKLD